MANVRSTRQHRPQPRGTKLLGRRGVAPTSARRPPARLSLPTRTGPVCSPLEFVGEPMSKTGPVLAAGVSRQHSSRSSVELFAPQSAYRLGIVVGWFVEAGQQLGGQIGALWLRLRKRFPKQSLGVFHHATTLQRHKSRPAQIARGIEFAPGRYTTVPLTVQNWLEARVAHLLPKSAAQELLSIRSVGRVGRRRIRR